MNAAPRVFYRLARLPLRPGFTLVEIIFASGLLALVLVMLFNLFPSSLFGIKMAEHRIRAAAQGQSVLEAAREETMERLATVVPTVLPSCMLSQGSDTTWYVTDRTVVLSPPSPWMTPVDLNVTGVNEIVVEATTYWNEHNDSSDVTQYTHWVHNIQQRIVLGTLHND